MTSNWVHPGFILILGSLVIPFLRGRSLSGVRKAYLLLLPALAFWAVMSMEPGTYWVHHVLGHDIVLGRVDKLALVFGYIFSLMAFIGMYYGLHVREDGHHMAAFWYMGGALGVTFAGDFITLIVFWEMMAFASVFLILYRREKSSYDSAFRYILVHVFGGVCVMGGAFLQYTQTQSIAFNHVEVGGLAAGLLLAGFMLNAAVPPFSAWLPDAYPEATISGAVFLCAFTTKTAIYVLARGFAGTEILIYLGVFMTLYGVGYAVIENNIRRLLSYHIISQVGYMVAGVGIGTHMAINGATAHAFAHILYKALLFMGAGSIIHVTGRERLSSMGGLYRKMPFTFVLYMIGGFAISGVPLFSGFVSKSLVVSAAAEARMPYVWLLLTVAAAGTFLSTTLKLPYLAFMGEDKKIEAAEPPANMLGAMVIAAGLCILIGVYPRSLYHLLPYSVDYLPYTPEHVVWSVEILLFTWLGYYLYIKKLYAKPALSLDTDWFYRKGGGIFIAFLLGPFTAFCDELARFVFEYVPGFFIWFSKNPLAALKIAFDKTLSELSSSARSREIQSRMEREKDIYPGDIIKHWPIGSTVLWVTLFLLTCLLAYYL